MPMLVGIVAEVMVRSPLFSEVTALLKSQLPYLQGTAAPPTRSLCMAVFQSVIKVRQEGS